MALCLNVGLFVAAFGFVSLVFGWVLNFRVWCWLFGCLRCFAFECGLELLCCGFAGLCGFSVPLGLGWL